MIKHIVMWRLHDSGDPVRQQARLLEIKRSLESLAGRVPGLLRIEVGIDFSRDASSADLVLYSEFPDRAALTAYQLHPEHQAVARSVRELASERRLVDYET